MKNRIIAFAVVASLPGCGQSNVSSQEIDSKQTFEITVDGKQSSLSGEDILSLNYVGQTHLTFAALSAKNDLSFSFSAFTQELKPGSYQVYDCKSASECVQEEDDRNQSVMLTPYPREPMSPVSASRVSYSAPELGLSPLTLIISAVTDEQQPGVPFKTKKVKGQFKGILAYVEKQQDGNWKVVGNTTNVEGRFDVFCTVR